MPNNTKALYETALVWQDFGIISETQLADTFQIPDPNFEQALLDLNIDSDGELNGRMAQADAVGIFSLDVSGNNISDLSGIEFFGDLESLNAVDNNLSNINLNENRNLQTLLLALNSLTDINLSNNTELISLSINQNTISNIDLTNNVDLVSLEISSNQINTIDLSNNLALTEVLANDNELLELDLSENVLLSEIDVSNNSLFNLNIQNGNNINIQDADFNAINNMDLVCIQVDDAAYSNSTWSNIDSQSVFSTNCSPENDDCLDAQSIGLGVSVLGSSISASSGIVIPECQDDTIVLFDVWYQFDAPASGAITAIATTLLGNLNANIAIYSNCNEVTPISCDSGTVALTDLIPGETYYIQVWIGGNPNGRSTQNQPQVGEFNLVVEDTSTLSELSIEPSKNDISISPNPAQDEFFIKSNTEFENVSIYNIAGQTVLSFHDVNSKDFNVNTATLSEGMYIVEISSTNQKVIKKLIIQ